MKELNSRAALILGISLMLGLGLLGYFLQQTAIQFKAYERVVTVKGLSEREYRADTVIWPIQFTVADNDVQKLFTRVESQTAIIETFLKEAGIDENVTLAAPAVIDKKAQQYGGEMEPQYRYLATQTITVFSTQVDAVRQAISQIGRLGKQGIVFNQDPYYNSVVYSFTKLNDVKPDMIEEATKNAREVAEKFAKDSHSTLGKIRNASQGQFTIYERDSNTPHIKIVRVVSTVQYYLSD